LHGVVISAASRSSSTASASSLAAFVSFFAARMTRRYLFLRLVELHFARLEGRFNPRGPLDGTVA
jgi:hypothetical protein